jgi:hypothetical protein
MEKNAREIDTKGRERFLRYGRYVYRGYKVFGLAIGGIFLAAFIALIFGWLVMLVWNWLMPGLFQLPVIGYWQAFGIIILGRLMIGAFPPSYYGHRREWDRTWNKFGRWSNWAPKGDPHNWRHYEEYWHDEGKKAFEDWLDRQKK